MYVIKNINSLAKILGKTVAKDADFSYLELKKYISVGNIKNIIKKHIEKDKNGNNSISNRGINDSMIEIFDWLVGRDLAALAAEDKVDCFWDDNKNEMIFKGKSEDFIKRQKEK